MKKMFLLSGVAMMALGIIESQAATQTWDCGEKVNGVYSSNVKCTLDDDGVFTVSGKGKVADYDMVIDSLYVSDAPWGGSMAAMNKIKQIVVEDGITAIGDNAFCGAREATSIYMPSVKVVGDHAFYDPYKVQTIYMPEVETVGRFSFAYAKVLTSIDMPKVKEIGRSAFAAHNQYPESLKYVGMPDDAVVNATAFLDNSNVAQCGNGGSCGGCGDGLIMPGQGCVSSCGAGYADYKGKCWLELPFSKKHWTPAEVNEWLYDDNNTITITFKK